MHFVFCLFNYFPYGGLQRDFIKIARAAIARGHQVTVFVMSWQGPVEPDLTIVLLPPSGFSNHQRAKVFSCEVLRRLSVLHYDVVLGFNRQAGLDFYFAADLSLAALLQQKSQRWKRFLPRYRAYLHLEAGVYGALAKTHILLLDPKQQALIQSLYHTPDERFSLLPPGIERPAQSAVGNRQALNPAEKLVLLAVGHYPRIKGLDRTLLALAALPLAQRQYVELWVVGQVDMDLFKKQAQQLGLEKQVQFLGERDDVYSLMQAADLFVHPAYKEVAGLVLIEALANGLPVVVTDNCGYAFHVANAQAGLVIAGGTTYRQSSYNAALSEALNTVRTGHWREKALTYSESIDLFSMPMKVIDHLEQFVALKC